MELHNRADCRLEFIPQLELFAGQSMQWPKTGACRRLNVALLAGCIAGLRILQLRTTREVECRLAQHRGGSFSRSVGSTNFRRLCCERMVSMQWTKPFKRR